MKGGKAYLPFMMNNDIKVVVGDYDVNRLFQLVNNLQGYSINIIGIAQTGKDLIDRAAKMAADAVLMEYSMVDLTAIDVAEKLKEESPGTLIFAISSNVSADFIFEAKRHGVTEVFYRDTLVPREVAEKIQSTVEEKRQEWEELAQTHGKVSKGTGPIGQKVVKEYITKSINQSIILTYNTKGGVGKSTIATNLALAIKMSPYLSGQRVALVDFDCGGANISTLCHIPDSHTLERNLAYWEGDTNRFTAQDVDELMVAGPHGLMVLPAPLNIVLASKIGYDLADNILTTLKKYFSIIVIDGAPNITATMDAALQHATHVLLIANAEGQSVKQLARITKLLSPDKDYPEKQDMSHILNKMFVVLNHAQGYSKWNLKADEVVETIGRPLLAEIPFSESVRLALHGNSRKQAIEIDNDGEFAVAIKRLANDLVSAYPEGIVGKPKIKNEDKEKKKGILSIFKKG